MYSKADVSGKVIDVQATFQPTFCSRAVTLAVKISILALTIAAAGLNFYRTYYDFPGLFLAYLTNWGVLLSIGYFIVALIGQFYGRTSNHSGTKPSSPPPSKELVEVVVDGFSDDSTEVPQELNMLQRVAWALFTSSLITEIIITILFWLLVYTPGEKLYFSEIYVHGGVLVTLIIDGFGIHHYPIRFKQIVWVYAVFILYIIWSVIHNLATNIGNPFSQDNDPDTDDDALYAPLNWKVRPRAAAILILILGIVAIPLLHVLMWGLSMLFPRRYLK